MGQLTVLDGTGAAQSVAKVVNTGSTTDSESLPVTRSTEDKAQEALIVKSLKPSDLAVNFSAAPNTGGTLTLPAAGAGLYHYITGIHIKRVATAALAGGAILNVTSTNLPGNPTFDSEDTFAAAGNSRDVDMEPTTPLKSSVVNTATTLVFPAPGAAVSWRALVTYYTGT